MGSGHIAVAWNVSVISRATVSGRSVVQLCGVGFVCVPCMQRIGVLGVAETLLGPRWMARGGSAAVEVDIREASVN